jgi:RNA polymerase sigma factor (sigma-70 family)
MSSSPPPLLQHLLETSDRAERESAWSALIEAHSRLLLYVCRSTAGDHDAVMDRYAWVLEHLRADDFRRLRSYVADGRSEFSTWLVVVAQRLCLDHHRRRYGRHRPVLEGAEAQDEEFRVRRRVVDLLAAQVDLAALADGKAVDPEDHIRVSDLYQALEAALGGLEPRDRLLVKLRFEDELPIPAIARALGLPSRFHVYRRLSTVLATLRLALERSGVRDAAP